MKIEPQISERDFLAAIIKEASLQGWLVAHHRPARTEDGHWVTAIQGDTGFFDLVLIRSPRVIFAEVKAQKGRLRYEQHEWIAEAEACPGVETFCWRPSQWLEIEEALR